MTARLAYCHECRDLGICAARCACVLEPGPQVNPTAPASRFLRIAPRAVTVVAVSFGIGVTAGLIMCTGVFA